MLADGAALARLDGAGARLQVAAQKFAKGPLADEANAGGVFLFGVGQPGFGGDAAHVAFAQIAHGKERAGKLRLREAVQKVALVFGRIGALEQLVAARGGVQALAGVVAGGNFFGAQAHGVVQKGLELDFGVAQHVRVGRAAGLIERALQVLDSFGIAHLHERAMTALSGCQQQLVLLAQRLIRQPRLLLLDEATSALVVIAIHDLNLATQHAQTVLMLGVFRFGLNEQVVENLRAAKINIPFPQRDVHNIEQQG